MMICIIHCNGNRFPFFAQYVSSHQHLFFCIVFHVTDCFADFLIFSVTFKLLPPDFFNQIADLFGIYGKVTIYAAVRHSVYLEVTAEISVVLPGRKTNFSTSSEVLIAESVLLGDVPEIYIQGDIFGKGYVSQ